MELVLVERSFEAPVDPASIQKTEQKSAWCLEEHSVRFVRSYVSSDGLRMICLYEAPDAEAVRLANRKAGLPFDRVWRGSVFDPAALPGGAVSP
jgi:hypothetical protein